MPYKKCSFLARRKMSIAELNAYYNAERKWRYHHSERIPGIRIRAWYHGALVVLLKLSRKANHQETLLVNIGENLDVCGMDRDKAELVRDLRDCMCTLKWEIWEKKSVEKRENLPENYHEIFCRQILDEAGEGYSQKLVEDETFHDRSAMEQCQVARELRRIVPSKANCYLFDKRNSGKVVSKKDGFNETNY